MHHCRGFSEIYVRWFGDGHLPRPGNQFCVAAGFYMFGNEADLLADFGPVAIFAHVDDDARAVLPGSSAN